MLHGIIIHVILLIPIIAIGFLIYDKYVLHIDQLGKTHDILTKIEDLLNKIKGDQ